MNFFHTSPNAATVVRVFYLPVLSGLLYWFSSQAFSFPLAVWICLVPLGLSLYGTTPLKGFASGLVYGFCFWFSATWWIKNNLVSLVNLLPWQAWSWTIVFCLFHAIPYAFLGWLAGRFRWMERLSGVFLSAAALVVIRTWYPHVFPGNEAHNLYQCLLLIQPLDIGGVPLLLFIVYLVNFLIVRALNARREHASPLVPLAAVAIVFLLLTGYGWHRITSLHRQMQAAEGTQLITPVSIQSNVPVNQSARDVPPEDQNNDMKTSLADTRAALLHYPAAELAILPELPVSYSCIAEAARDLPPLAAETGRALMVPCTGMFGDNAEAYYNSVFFTDRRGKQAGEYRKLILAPFGEYIPMERRFPFLRRLFPGVMPFVAGEKPVLFDLGKERLLIPSLCYEAIFTAHTRRFVKLGGTVLVNMVNDAWFGKTKASSIHLSLAIYRAIEYRIPMVRVTNSGISAFIQPTGEIVPGSKTSLFEKTVRSFSLFIPKDRSPYYRWGDFFLYGLSLYVFAGVGIEIIKRRYG